MRLNELLTKYCSEPDSKTVEEKKAPKPAAAKAPPTPKKTERHDQPPFTTQLIDPNPTANSEAWVNDI